MTTRMRVVVGAAAGSVLLTVAACGGSEVAPEDFVNSGVYAGQLPNQQGPGAVPGVGVPQPQSVVTDGAADPGAGVPGVVPDQPGAQPGTGSSGGPGSPSAPSPNNGVKVASCAGFKNGPGMTDSEIKIASIADISGPVPNTFKPVHDAMNAFVAYFNATSSICGRKLRIVAYDSGLSGTGSNDASKAACNETFAAVGSLSAFDSGGANVTAACGQPDLRATATEPARQKAATTFQMVPIDSAHFGIQPWAWIKQQFGRAVKNAGFVYLNAGASITISKAIIAQTTAKLGYDWKKTIIVDIAGVPNWNAYANQFKSAGIKFVSSNLADFSPKLAAAFKQANYHPIYLADNSAYGPKYLAGSTGAAMDGAYSYTQTAMLEEADRVPEMKLYQTWLQRTGGEAPAYSGAEAWAAGELFVKVALELGGKLTRESMLQRLRTINKWTGYGIVAPGDPSNGSSAPCATMMQIAGGRFVRKSPFPYTCGPLG